MSDLTRAADLAGYVRCSCGSGELLVWDRPAEFDEEGELVRPAERTVQCRGCGAHGHYRAGERDVKRGDGRKR